MEACVVCIVWLSFLFGCFVKIWATCENFLRKWFTKNATLKRNSRLISGTSGSDQFFVAYLTYLQQQETSVW